MASIKHSQKGYTLISLIFILGLVAFFVLLILKIAPIYMDHSKVVNALAAVKQTTDVQSMSEAEVRSTLDKRFNLNYVNDAKMEDVKITKRGNYLRVEIVYEVVQKIAGNLSVLVEFNDKFEVGQE
jgi:competence protein ComGC